MGLRDPGVTEIAAKGMRKPKTHILENRNPIRFFFKLLWTTKQICQKQILKAGCEQRNPG